MAYIKPNYDKRDMDKPPEKRRIISYRIAVIRGKKENGKPDYHWETVPGDSITALKKRIRALESEIDRGVYVAPTKLTLKSYLESWLEDYCKPNLSPDTTETYRIMCNAHIYPTLGNKTLTALKSQDIQHLESQKLLSGRHDGKGGLSNRSVQYIHTTLNKALKMAVKAGILMRNPCDGVEPPKVKRHEFKTLAENDINKLLEALKESEYYPLFFTDLFSGMRRSELLALRWKDIDLFNMTASVNRALKCLHKEIVFRPTKTVKSRRLIALTPANCNVLREHQTKQEQDRRSLYSENCPKCHKNNWDRTEAGVLKCLDCENVIPTIKDEDLVFCHFDGKPYLPDSITHVWMMLVRRNGLTGTRLHDIRHSHASLLLKQGIHPKIVQERLGHATISTTLDLYSHVAPGLQAAAAAKFDDILKPKETKLEKALKEMVEESFSSNT